MAPLPPFDAAHPLNGVGVLVTRPAHQAEALCRLIDAAGGRPVRFPALEIAAPADPAPARAVVRRLADFDLAIFISANAARAGLALIREHGDMPAGLKIAAIGQASARELEHHGCHVDLCPAAGFNSEALLAEPQLQDISGLRVVIFRGEGGRELLAETLRQRGAAVEYAQVYRRARPAVSADDLLRRWSAGEIQIVVATSNDALRNLYALVGEAGRAGLRETPLVVVSARMLQLARELGVVAEIVVAAEPGDPALVQAIVDWRRRLS